MIGELKIKENGETYLQTKSREAREEMLRKNINNGSYSIGSPTMEDDKSKIYSETHTNAKSDFTINQPTNKDSEVDKGKGIPSETFNMFIPNSLKTEKGGSRTDVFGVVGLDSGRVRLTQKNNYYNKEDYSGRKANRYSIELKVDTKNNKAQFKLK
jgi:hypothetical protein